MRNTRFTLIPILFILLAVNPIWATPRFGKKAAQHLAKEFHERGWNSDKRKSCVFNDYNSTYKVKYPVISKNGAKGLTIKVSAEYFTKTHALSGQHNDEGNIELTFNAQGELEAIQIFIKWINKTRYRKAWNLSDFNENTQDKNFEAWEADYMRDSAHIFDTLVHVDKHDGRYTFRNIFLRVAQNITNYFEQ